MLQMNPCKLSEFCLESNRISWPMEQIPELCWMKCTEEPAMLLRLGLSNGLVIVQWELETSAGSIGHVTSI